MPQPLGTFCFGMDGDGAGLNKQTLSCFQGLRVWAMLASVVAFNAGSFSELYEGTCIIVTRY